MSAPEAVHVQRFERIVAEHGAALGRLAAVHARDPDERQDVLQEILLAVWRALPTFRGECSERTFVYRIGHNRALTYRTRHTRAREHARLDDLPDLADPHADPHAALTASQAQERLLRAVGELPEGVRQVVLLHLEGLDHREITQILGISENNVAVRLSRGRTALRRRLVPQGGETAPTP